MIYDFKFWKNYFKTYDVLNNLIPYKDLLTKLVQSAMIKSGDKCLDLGSGTGNLSKFINVPVDLIFFDNSIVALEIAAAKAPQSRRVQGSIYDPLPFAENEFDVIICNNVLYTIPLVEWPKILKEIRRVLKPQGRLVMSNLHIGFSPIKIYQAHVKQYVINTGRGVALLHLLKLLVPTVKMFWYNNLISKSFDRGEYHFVLWKEQSRILREQHFSVYQDEIPVYGDQAYMVVALK